MRIEVIMPRMGQSMEEGTLLTWFKAVGDTVHKGDTLIEIESDKATVEIEAFASGELVEILVAEGDAVPVGAVLGYIEDGKGIAKDAVSSSPVQVSAQNRVIASPLARRLARENSLELAQQTGTGTNGMIIKRDIDALLQQSAQPAQRLDISPVARRLASEHQLDVTEIAGSGPRGRVIKRDIESAINQTPPPPAENYLPQSKIQKATAHLMKQSKTTIPHFYVSMDIQMDEALALQAQLKSRGHKISVNSLILKAVAMTLLDYPNLNATYHETGIEHHEHVNLAVAVALTENDRPTGLITPVITACETLPLVTLAQKADDVIGRARENRLKAHELGDGTFTVSNLGMFGVRHFEAIVNPPQVAILAIGGIRRIPTFDEHDNVRPMSMLTVTLSADHRVADGAEVASFLRDMKVVLEDGLALMIEK